MFGSSNEKNRGYLASVGLLQGQIRIPGGQPGDVGLKIVVKTYSEIADLIFVNICDQVLTYNIDRR